MEDPLQRLRENVPELEESQYKTDVMHQWFLPLMSPYTIGMMLIGVVAGMCVVAIEDRLDYEILINDLSSFELILAVLIAQQLNTLYTKYNDNQMELSKIAENEIEYKSDEIKKLVIGILFNNPTQVSKARFEEWFAPIKTSSSTIDMKYTSYTILHNSVHTTHNSALNTLIWWLIQLYCCICIPLVHNNVDSTIDYTWLGQSLVKMLVMWASFGVIDLFVDILRPTHLWVYSILKPNHLLTRGRGVLNRILRVREPPMHRSKS